MNRNKILIGVGVIALLGVGYLVYRKLRTSSDSAEKNNRKIRIIGNKNVTPQDDDLNDTTETQTEI
jgi:flagellar biogenesis protein FliO